MYLQQAFRGKNKFTHYLAGIILLFVSTQIIGALPLVIATAINKILNPDVVPSISNSFGLDQNLGLALMLLPFMVGCFTLYYVIKKIHKKKFNDVLTTRPKFDFKRAGIGALIWAGILFISSIPIFLNTDQSIVFQFDPIPFFILLVICVLILPFQTSFEELVFRGYFMQGLAVATKNRWFPLLITSITFGLMHAANPEVAEFGFWMAMPSYIIMGLVMGLVAVMDNGLEISLGMHFANNCISAIFFTSTASALQTPALFKDTDPSMSSLDNIMMVATSIVFLLICSKVFKWKDWGKLFRKIEVPQE